MNIGTIDQEGFINHLNGYGYTTVQCFAELFENSIDGQANNIINKVTKNNINIIDDGIGMTKENCINMFSMFRSNHSTDKSIGISGVGGKAATKILSCNSLVKIYTKNKDDIYLKIIIPWDEIVSNKIYQNQIKITEMSQSDIEYFNNEIGKYNENLTGTIISFKNLKSIFYTIFNCS